MSHVTEKWLKWRDDVRFGCDNAIATNRGTKCYATNNLCDYGLCPLNEVKGGI